MLQIIELLYTGVSCPLHARAAPFEGVERPGEEVPPPV